MNDLNQINAANARAIADSIPALRAAGKWVVSSYAGLHFVDCQAFEHEHDARTELAAQESKGIPGNRYQLLEPTGTAAADHVGESQSVTTAIGGGSGDLSGGDDDANQAALTGGAGPGDHGGGSGGIEGDGLAAGSEGDGLGAAAGAAEESSAQETVSA